MTRLLVCLMLVTGLSPAQTVRTVCSSGCAFSLSQLQEALDAAVAGDIIEITAGETATTSTGLVLRNKNTDGGPHIIIRSSGVVNLPAGQRVKPTDAANLARISTTTLGNPVIRNEKGAAFYKFHGIEIVPVTGRQPINVVEFGTATSVGHVADHERSHLAHDIIFDQCYIHDAPGSTDLPRRLIIANCGRLDVVNSWLTGAKNQNGESNAIGSWNGSGPFHIANNHIEAVGITTLFGGAVPNIQGLRATGLRFMGNHFYRSWKWRVRTQAGDPTGTCLYDAEGGEWYKNKTSVTYWHCVSGTWTQVDAASYSPYYWQKNIFELKNATDVLVEGNYFENAWQPGTQNQAGAIFLFNLVDVDGAHPEEPAATIGQVRIRNNYGRRAPWMMVLGRNVGPYFRNHHDITVENNLFDEMGDAPFTLGSPADEGSKAGSNLLCFLGPTSGVRYLHNTINTTNPVGQVSAFMYGVLKSKDQSAVAAGNILPWSHSGFYSDAGGGNLWNAVDTALGTDHAIFRNVVVNNLHKTAYNKPSPVINLMTNSDSTGRKPCPSCAIPENFENGGTSDVGFVNYSARNFRLAGNSLYKSWAHLGLDAGADIDAVEASTATGVSGAPNPYLDFVIRAVSPTADSASIRYTAYSPDPCAVLLSEASNLSSPVYDQPDGGGDLDRVITVSSLRSDTRYFYRITCAGNYRRGGVLLTAR